LGELVLSIILIVEDDEQVRTLAESILAQAGHETRSAGSSAEAEAILQSDAQVDLLFVDVTLLMHDEAGLHLAKAAARVRPGLPVMYTTGRGITDGMLAMFVKPNVFLAKPYNVEQLLTAVANLLNSASRRLLRVQPKLGLHGV
jgi:DNA-binding NtrC family response regulator